MISNYDNKTYPIDDNCLKTQLPIENFGSHV